jgi:hypothetical protein
VVKGWTRAGPKLVKALRESPGGKGSKEAKLPSKLAGISEGEGEEEQRIGPVKRWSNAGQTLVKR